MRRDVLDRIAHAIRSRAAAALVTLGVAALLPGAARAAVTELPLPQPDSSPAGITAGPDGALWFTELGDGLGAGDARIGRITTDGHVTEYPLPTGNGLPLSIARGPDGALWFTEWAASKVGRITTAGAISEFDIGIPGVSIGLLPKGITAGPDGALWFTELGHVARITTSGAVTHFLLPTPQSDTQGGIAVGADGALWFTEANGDRIGRITTDGRFTEYPLPTPDAVPAEIVAGSDGALWFTEPPANQIGRITTGGAITEYRVPTPGSAPEAITAGPDGALWFVEAGADKIGRITTRGRIRDFRLPHGAGEITTGPDRRLWFTEPATNAIGRIPARVPRQDSVDGGFLTQPPCDRIGCTPPRYLFGVSSRRGGRAPFGSVTYETGERSGTTMSRGTVTCLRVRGNRAVIGVNFPESVPGYGGATRGALIFLEDNGPVTQDRWAVEDLPAGTAPSRCPSRPPPGVTLGPAYGFSTTTPDPGVVIRRG